VALALGLSLCGGHAAQAGGALIETTAPLTDRSEESVKAAVIAAIDRAVRGASAMGFAWFQLRDAQVSEHEVAVQILATDEEPAKPEQPEPDSSGPPRDGGGAVPDPEARPIAPGPRVPI
jgi:hypothetical protein